MKQVLLFGLLAMGFAANTFLVESLVVQVLMGTLALSFFGLAIGFGIIGPGVFLKDQCKGTLSLFSWLIFLPLHLLNLGLLFLIAKLGRERAYDEIVPGVFLGRRLGSREARPVLERGVQAVLDLTSEFAECRAFRGLTQYCCLPLLDTREPTSEQIQRGVAFMADNCGRGGVYVHCAMGHGRSATFVAAFLLRQGTCRTTAEAEEFIRQRRPRVGLHAGQRKALTAWRATWSNP